MKSKWNDDLDFRILGNDPVLDRQVAEALGWRVVKLDEPEKIWVNPPGVEIVLNYYQADENGERVTDNWQTEDLVWEHSGVPLFSSDLNTAVRLIGNMYFLLETRRDHSEKTYWHAEVGLGSSADAPTPSRAICLAWLIWKDKQP